MVPLGQELEAFSSHLRVRARPTAVITNFEIYEYILFLVSHSVRHYAELKKERRSMKRSCDLALVLLFLLSFQIIPGTHFTPLPSINNIDYLISLRYNLDLGSTWVDREFARSHSARQVLGVDDLSVLRRLLYLLLPCILR